MAAFNEDDIIIRAVGYVYPARVRDINNVSFTDISANEILIYQSDGSWTNKTLTEVIDAADGLTLNTESSTPSDPVANSGVIWLDSSGNLKIKVTIGVVTNIGTLFTF